MQSKRFFGIRPILTTFDTIKKQGMDVSGKNFKAFLDRQEALKKQYSSKNAEKQHSKGKLTAHERIKLLFDSGTFEEIDAFVTPAASLLSLEKST